MYRRTTIPRYRALQAHWRRFPRAEWLIAGYLGFKPAPEIVPVANVKQSVRQKVAPPTGAMMTLFQQFGGAAGKPAVINP